jgi:putative SOS response-associated peptidase YedK
MCGRFTAKMTWADIVALYWLALHRPPHNLQPRYNVCPTDSIDVVTEKRDFARIALGLVPRSRTCR